MSQLPPAGWHPDPLGRHAQRYWDGSQWTEHVADTAGNMTTDPLNLGGGQAAQQGGQAETAQDTAEAQADQGATWGDTGQQDQGSADSAEAWTGGTTAAAGAAAAGAAAAGAGAVEQGAADEAEHAHEAGEASAHAEDVSGHAEGDTGHAEDEPVMAITLDDLDGVDEGSPSVMESMDGTVALGAVDRPVVVRTDALIATSGATSTPGDGVEVFDGDGEVWVGRAGTYASILEVEDGLVVSGAHLMAWSTDQDPTETSSGIAGFDGHAFSGDGYVVVATGSGLVLCDASPGVQVRAGRLVAHTAGLDVQHGEHIDVHGEGWVFAAAG